MKCKPSNLSQYESVKTVSAIFVSFHHYVFFSEISLISWAAKWKIRKRFGPVYYFSPFIKCLHNFWLIQSPAQPLLNLPPLLFCIKNSHHLWLINKSSFRFPDVKRRSSSLHSGTRSACEAHLHNALNLITYEVVNSVDISTHVGECESHF